MDRYTVEQKGKIHHLYNEWDRTGQPELVARLNKQIEDGTDFDMLFPFVHQAEVPAFRPKIEIPSLTVSMPPRNGQAATKKAWLKFASSVTDVDPTVWESMSRNEIITVLEDMDVIDSEDIE